MAMIITKNIKGLDCNYHIIDNCIRSKRNNHTEVSLLHYVDKTARDADIENFISIENKVIEGIQLTPGASDVDYAYIQLTKSGAEYYGAVNDSK